MGVEYTSARASTNTQTQTQHTNNHTLGEAGLQAKGSKAGVGW